MSAPAEDDATIESYRPQAQPSAADMASPGASLRNARRERRMEVSRIASELRLKSEIIEALERDDFERLPGAVFVAGYIRSYARLVGLDPEPLNSRFRELYPGAVAPPYPRPQPPSTARSGRTPVVLVLSLLVLGGAMAYLWWHSNRQETPATTSAPFPDSRIEARELRDAMGPGAAATGIGDAGALDAAREEAIESTPLSDEPQGDLTVTDRSERESVAATVSEQPKQSDDADEASRADGGTRVAGNGRQTAISPLVAPPAPEAPVASATPDMEAAPRTESEPDSNGSPVPAAAEGRVIISFTGPCWVDIRDADGKVQLFGEMAAGDRHALDGDPPYSLVIGNASATELTVAGQPFDLLAVSEGNVARFVLDPVELAGPDAAARNGSRGQPVAGGD